MNTIQFTDKLKQYLIVQIDNLSKETPVVGFMKPFIDRAINKNFNKVEKLIDLISDQDNNIDVDNIITEIIENIMTTKPFTFKVDILGNIEIGGGCIKLNIPLTDKKLILNTTDLQNFKELLINNKD